MFSETEFKSLLPPKSLQIKQVFSRWVGTHPYLHKIYCKHCVLRWGFALPFNQEYQTMYSTYGCAYIYIYSCKWYFTIEVERLFSANGLQSKLKLHLTKTLNWPSEE